MNIKFIEAVSLMVIVYKKCLSNKYGVNHIQCVGIGPSSKGSNNKQVTFV